MNPYFIARPNTPALPLVFDSPHSGTTYPADFGYACDFLKLQEAEDRFVDELFSAAPAHGAPLLCATFPRSYIDANRPEDDIDPALLSSPWPKNYTPSSRALAGIGLVRRLVQPGLPVYDGLLSPADIQHRIDTYYRPYHAALKNLLDESVAAYGQVWHINCHSMPARNLFPSYIGRTADFVLGDRDGTTCDIHFVHAMRDFLKGLGYRVAINDPYKGVELVRAYSNPAAGRHSIQVEVSRALYLNEPTGEKSRGFGGLKENMDALVNFCADYARARQVPMAAD